MTANSHTGLARYLQLKADAMRATAAELPNDADHRETISARCTADDLTGVRKLRIRDWQYIGDSGPAMGGWNLGPSSPELLCGVVSTCLVHTYLIAAANQGIPLDGVDIEVTAQNNDARFYGIATDDPSTPFEFRATVRLTAPDATPEQVAGLHRYADSTCPVMKVLRNPVEIDLIVAEPLDT
ncbi:OsmC family protein [Pseudonocardia sp. N23]|uniref:OsmC family protein n=1 Tax=Pseudonocardia sp. N23 TaxID=1987376 RepID=UPI000BFCE46D|nr:OsmC family protein [Pseudonocardia sp. N23]